MWHVSFRCGVATLRTAIHLLRTLVTLLSFIYIVRTELNWRKLVHPNPDTPK